MAEEKNTKIVEENKPIKKLEEFKNLEENKEIISKLEGKTKSKESSDSVGEKEEKKSNKKQSAEKKPELVREYVVPLRRGFSHIPQYRRAKKAIKVLKEFLAKHMRVEDRDLRKVKIDKYLNNEIWHRGIRKPLPRIKVIAEKIDGIVYAKLADVPEIVKFKMAKDERKLKKVDKKAVAKVKKQEDAEKEIREDRGDKQDKAEEKEMEKIGAEAKELMQGSAAKIQKTKTNAKPNKADVSVLGKKSLKK